MKRKFYSIFFPQVLYKFTGSVLWALTGETWLRRSDLKRAQFLYREKENKKKNTPSTRSIHLPRDRKTVRCHYVCRVPSRAHVWL